MVDLKKIIGQNIELKQQKPIVDNLFALGLAHKAFIAPAPVQIASKRPEETKKTTLPLPPRPPTKNGLG